MPFFERCRALRATENNAQEENVVNTFVAHIQKAFLTVKLVIRLKKLTYHKTVAQDIKGIVYYIDDENNVYHPQDVMNNSVNPKIIAKYQIINGKYVIPDLFKK